MSRIANKKPPAFAVLLAATLVATGCAHGRETPPSDGREAPSSAAASVDKTMTDKPPERADLPYARGRRFASLDDYLAFRRQLGQTDRPWYEEVSPGVYRLVARTLPRDQPQLFTRRQLMEQFGFDH